MSIRIIQERLDSYDELNYEFLSNALNQQGPWQGKNLVPGREWYLEHLEKRIGSIDLEAARREVAPFLKSRERETLELWNRVFFLSRVKKMADYS